jgi:hypothetical protein
LENITEKGNAGVGNSEKSTKKAASVATTRDNDRGKGTGSMTEASGRELSAVKIKLFDGQ